MSRPTVLVLGANGRFGAAAVNAFAAAGWRVLAQLRRAPSRPLPSGASALTLALADSDALAAAAGGAGCVIYAVNPVYTRWDAEALPLARQGMDLAQRLGARFLLPGNVYNFGETMPALLDEDTPELRSTVIRAGDFYGAGRGSWLDLVIAKSVARGRLVYPGPLDRPHAWAYLPDLARAFVAVAARADAPAVERWHFAGHTLTGRELLVHLETAARAMGIHPARGFRHGGMPWSLIRAAGLLHPMSREIARMSYLWRVPHALDGSALESAVGPLRTTPAADALRQALADLGVPRHPRRGGLKRLPPRPAGSTDGEGAYLAGLATGLPPATHLSNTMSTEVTLVKPRSCSDLVASAQRPPVAQYKVICLFMSTAPGKPASFQMRNSIRPRGTFTAPGM